MLLSYDGNTFSAKLMKSIESVGGHSQRYNSKLFTLNINYKD